MIKIIYGPKGYGKTKILLNELNNAGENAKGNVVFITDKRVASASINFNVRCVYTEEYEIAGSQMLTGFVNGLLAGNSDIEFIYIDGLKRIIGEDLRAGNKLFKAFAKLQKDYPDLKIIVTVTADDKQSLPSYIRKYAK